MDSHTIFTWLQSKKSGAHGALEEQVETFQALFDSKVSPRDAATAFDHKVQASRHEGAAWRFRQLLFAITAELPRLHPVLFQLVHTIRLIPPRPEASNVLDMGLWSNWSDMHNYLWGRRMLAPNETDDSRPSMDVSNAERACNFAMFSANIIWDTDDYYNIRIAAFFDIRDALEVFLESLKERLPENCVLSAQQVKAIDVEIAALWIVHRRDGILRIRNTDFGEDCKTGLAMETDLWHGEPGFSAERWVLWERELRQLASRELDNRRRELALKAAMVISNR